MRYAVFAAVIVLSSSSLASAQTSAPLLGAPVELPRLTARGEYLLWWVKDSRFETPLLTTGPTGILGQPGTSILQGGRDVDLGLHSGGRFALGYQVSDEWALEATYLFLSQKSAQSVTNSDGSPASPFLYVPFLDATTGSQNVTYVSFPRAFAGTAQSSLSSLLTGGEANAVVHFTRGDGWRLDLLAGFRYLYLNEVFQYATSSPNVPPLPTDFFVTNDRFAAANHFYGGQVGANLEIGHGPWSVTARGKVAFGGTQEIVNIAGQTVTNSFTPGVAQTFPGGYFAQPTNLGRYVNNSFSIVPEMEIKAGCQLTSWLRVTVGYTFLYVSRVARPGDQIDRTINPTQNPSFTGVAPSVLAGPARPAFTFREADFWAQGVSFGVEFTY